MYIYIYVYMYPSMYANKLRTNKLRTNNFLFLSCLQFVCSYSPIVCRLGPVQEHIAQTLLRRKSDRAAAEDH